MLGEYGSDIDDAPYLLERIFDKVWEEGDAGVKISLITASVKVFLKRPLEARPLLERTLYAGIEESTDPDVRDSALFHFRLLKLVGPENSANVLLGDREASPVRQPADPARPVEYGDFNSMNLIRT